MVEKKRFDEELKNETNKTEINSKKLRVFLILSLIVFVSLAFTAFFLVKNVSAQIQASYCCEKAINGAWCQNSPPAECNPNYRSPRTSCEATSFCKLGTCVNSKEGLCSPNVPQKVCQDAGGVWYDKKINEIPQCQLGCCFVGENTAFTTQTRCKSLGTLYGTNTTFKKDIKTELECISSANPNVEGACVLDNSIERTCKRLTRGECLKIQQTASTDTTVEFHEGFLCSAEILATNCAPTKRTKCVENKDGVYFVDSCGNTANVYDASKVNNQEYWAKIKTAAESCNADSNNANSASCGNCNYLGGSVCKAYQRGSSQTTIKPTYGDFVCADLSCKYKGKTYQHGETWCATASSEAGKKNENLPGDEYARLVCYNGEVTVEPCDPFRQTICLETETVPGFKSAACIVNRWQDCISQKNKEDCENIDKRDCKWVGEGARITMDGGLVTILITKETEANIKCVPINAPGFNFWNPDGQAEELCALANNNCLVKFEKKIGGDWKCKENCHCLGMKKDDEDDVSNPNNNWVKQMSNMCLALGDCSAYYTTTTHGGRKGYTVKNNYLGIRGYNVSS